MSDVRITGLGLTYPDGFTALRNIDLTVGDGEFVALVGPSGSGKTSLLRTVAGFLRPTTGTVAIGGTEVAAPGRAQPPEARRLGMVFQQHAIWPHMSVGANVGYALRIARRPRAEAAARVAEVLELVGLGGLANRNPATLSGGQRQRVALARALAPAPRVLLLDEALSALDEPLRDQLRVELKTLTRTLGLTVVHVTHDRDEALALADRIAVLDHGRIVQTATPAELLETPRSAFVATFLSDATLLPGTLGRGTAGFRADAHPLRLDAADVVVAANGTRTAGDRAGEAARGQVGETTRGQLAVLPHDVELTADTDGGAAVISSLYGRAVSDVIVDWAGVRLRSGSAWRPEIGDRTTVRVHRGIFYPEGPHTAGPH